MVKLLIPKRTSKSTTLEQFKLSLNSKKIRKSKVYNKIAFGEDNQKELFKWKKPSVRIKNIDISLQQKIQQVQLMPFSHGEKNIGSFFLDELEQAHFSDFSQDFARFYFQIIDLCQNLPLLLHNLDQIVATTVSYLDVKDCTFLIIKILPSLIRDAQQDIYKPFCKLILPKLVEKINIIKIDQLELIYTTIAFCLKFLFKSIEANLAEFYKVFQAQLFHQRNPNL